MDSVKISSIKFVNFKALSYFSISLQAVNILVGPNNSGKSTIISAFRILDIAIRKARSKKPERVPLPSGSFGSGYSIPEKSISVSLENVSTNYNEEDSRIEFNLTNQNKLILFFPHEGGCFLIPEKVSSFIKSPSEFKKHFPINVQVVPVLGPIEHNEEVVTEETVRSSLGTHRASRHFRNYWRYSPDGWEEFSAMIAETWPGMEIKIPEKVSPIDNKLTMFCSENRIDREIYWSGFGFQVWCQLLTHLFRARQASIVIIDEPEIYLHPDVQRQLLGILRGFSTDVLLATHSVEIMGEADPTEILLIDKQKKTAQRLRDVEGIQQAIEALGSTQNVTLTQLARTKKIVFVEGMDDYRILRRFAQRLGFQELASGNDLTAFESGGFSSWDRVKALSWGLSKTLEAQIPIAAIYDRDYFCDEKILNTLHELSQEVDFAHIHGRKEIENYLLIIPVLERALSRSLREREKRVGNHIQITQSICDFVEEITAELKADIQGQYISKRNDHFKNSRKDSATVTTEAITLLERKWLHLDSRMEIVPGKKVIKLLREKIHSVYKVNLTDNRIIDEFRINEIPEDMISLIRKLEDFRIGKH